MDKIIFLQHFYTACFVCRSMTSIDFVNTVVSCKHRGLRKILQNNFKCDKYPTYPVFHFEHTMSTHTPLLQDLDFHLYKL